jgi:hypothetical protein
MELPEKPDAPGRRGLLAPSNWRCYRWSPTLNPMTHRRPSMSIALRIAAMIVFVLATAGVAPVPMTPRGLTLWCASTLVR